MNRKKNYLALLLTSKIYSKSDGLLESSTSSPKGNGLLSISILFVLFLLSLAGGYKLIKLRTGNYDIDYFTRLLGWALFIFGVYGLFST